MVFLYILCFAIAVIAITLVISEKDGKKILSPTGMKISLVVAAIALIFGFVFMGINNSSDSGKSSNKWDDLTEEEKDWYRDNYGNGQYDKYQDAINDYKNK